jgi:hypothetical protein
VKCRSSVKERFGGTYHLHLQGRKIHKQGTSMSRCLADFSILKMEAIRSSKTSVHTRSIRRHIQEDGIRYNNILYLFPEIILFCCTQKGHKIQSFLKNFQLFDHSNEKTEWGISMYKCQTARSDVLRKYCTCLLGIPNT